MAGGLPGTHSGPDSSTVVCTGLLMSSLADPKVPVLRRAGGSVGTGCWGPIKPSDMTSAMARTSEKWDQGVYQDEVSMSPGELVK